VTTIELTTRIEAPVERVFDLSRSIDLHRHSATGTREEAVAGVTTGLIGLDQEVTWRARHFGLPFQMTVRITRYDRPTHFRDEMIRGPFAAMVHDHDFEQEGTATLMRDIFRFASPLGALGGRLVDRVILRPYLHRFLLERNRVIRETAESDHWNRFL